MSRLPVSILVLLSVGGALIAQPVGHVSLPDADGDGHPLFGTPQVRPNFVEVNGVSVGAHATTVSFGDIDGDGDMDAVVASAKAPRGVSAYSYVTLMLNTGDGVFGAPRVVHEGRQVTMALLADVNSDGLADLCLTDASASSVSILLSTGGGGFAEEVMYAVGRGPLSLVLADFDGDGDLDMATLNHVSADVSTLLNRGDGTFEAEQRMDPGAPIARGLTNVRDSYPGPFLAAGDLTGDGIVDLAIPGSQQVMILTGDGAGGFAAILLRPQMPGKRAYDIKIADLDGDGDADMAVATRRQNATIEVLINKGGGLFGPSIGYEASWTPDENSMPVTISLADVDGDADLDIAVGYINAAGVTVLRNAGDGTFDTKDLYHAIDRPWFVRFEDVNVDGTPDLVVLADKPYAHEGMLRILFNVGQGRLLEQEGTPEYSTAATAFPWTSPQSVSVADIDADGDLDLVVANGASDRESSVNLLFNDGSGVFDPITPLLLGRVGESSPAHTAIVDLNGDGILDLAVADNTLNREFLDGRVWVMLGKGGGAFERLIPVEFPGLVPEHIGTGDLDGDGDIDLAVWAAEPVPDRNTTLIDRRVVIMLNDGQGKFTIDSQHLIGTAVWLWSNGTMAVGDFDQDGDLDLAATMGPRFGDAKLAVLLNDGAANFTMAPIIVIAYLPWSSITLDYDGDGDLDLAVGHNVGNYGLSAKNPYITLLQNDGSANFTIAQEFFDPHLYSIGFLSAADLDGDGDVDLFMPSESGVIVHLNDGQGNFAPFVRYGTGNGSAAIAVGDIDNDGRLDLITGDWRDSNINVLRNVGELACYADCDQSSGVGVLDLADFLCFQTAFMNADPYACNCDTTTGPLVCDIFDFLCFQNAFVGGCS